LTITKEKKKIATPYPIQEEMKYMAM